MVCMSVLQMGTPLNIFQDSMRNTLLHHMLLHHMVLGCDIACRDSCIGRKGACMVEKGTLVIFQYMHACLLHYMKVRNMDYSLNKNRLLQY